LIVVSLLAGPSDWIRPPSFFVEYSLGALSFLVTVVVVWIVCRTLPDARRRWDAER